MIRLALSVIVLVLCLSHGNSQVNLLSYRDLEIGRFTNLRPNTLSALKWYDDSTLVYFENDSLFKINVLASGDRALLTTVLQINENLKTTDIKSVKPYAGNFTVLNKNLIKFSNGKSYFVLNQHTEEVEYWGVFPEDAQNIEPLKDYSKVSYTIGQDIYFVDSTNTHSKITNETLEGVVNGQVPHRNEFGIANGSYWSENGSRLVFYRKDESMVENYPLVDINERTAKVRNIRYPMAGLKSEQVKVMVYDVKTSSLVEIQTGGDSEQYLTNLSVSLDEKEVYIQHLNRAQNHMHLIKYSALTGSVIDTLFEETHEKYVEPQHPLVFSAANIKGFYYQSQRDGFNHIYFYDEAKKELNQLTRGKWSVTEFIGIDADEQNAFFMGTKESPLERHLYKLNLKSLKISRLTSDHGTHKVTFNSTYTRFVDQYSSTEIANKIDVRDVDGKLIKNVLQAPNPLAEYELGEVETGTFIGGDGQTDLYYRMVKPVDFDPNKKYPVIFYVYGGPHAQLITNSWTGRTDLWFQYMAQQGFIGITIDTRGSYGRGVEFENVIHRQSGIPQMEDIVSAVDFIAEKDFIDTSRIGIHGWSYGGYMAITMMTRHADKFKVGVAGGPVIDWKYYEVMYGERYMDTPEENPEGYELTNLNNYAGELKGKLKIIHGSVDPVVVWQNSMSFVESCVKAGTYPDYFMYPLHEHNVRGFDRIHLVELVSSYFIENL